MKCSASIAHVADWRFKPRHRPEIRKLLILQANQQFVTGAM
jgi:hypothetical protein